MTPYGGMLYPKPVPPVKLSDALPIAESESVPVEPPKPKMLVIARGDTPTPLAGTEVITPNRFDPNYIVTVLTPFGVILVRASRNFLQTLAGLLSASGIGAASHTLPGGDFWHLLWVCSGLALSSTVWCVIQNTAELLAKWDETKPELRG